jgi:cytochrome c
MTYTIGVKPGTTPGQFTAAGSLPNYGYSSAMKGADFVWDKEKLDRFIAKPDEVVPGHNIKPYGGLTSAEDRAKIIVFLESPTTN